MRIQETKIAGCYVIDLEPIGDNRGFFSRSFCPDELSSAGLGYTFKVHQTNIAFNEKRGTLRGMHWQADPVPDPKIVRATSGAIWDVVIDIREGSPTFGQWVGEELSAANHRAVLVPPNCAHGLITLEDATEVHYLMGADFVPELGRGLPWNDPAFAVEWPIEPTVISEKDASYEPLKPTL